MDRSRVFGIVLAAGRSERMGGRVKALLTIEDPVHGYETFVARAVRILQAGGVQDVVVVANSDTAESVRGACPHALHAVNPRPEDGMVSSIRAAIAAYESVHAGWDGAVVTLADIPEVAPSVVDRLRSHVPRQGTWMALPAFEDGRGHPLVLYPGIRDALSEPLPKGLKTIMERYPDALEDIPVPGVQPWDVDTPEDYARYRP